MFEQCGLILQLNQPTLLLHCYNKNKAHIDTPLMGECGGRRWEGRNLQMRLSSREITSCMFRDKLKETIMERRISCLAYLIRKGCVEKLWSVSSIPHTPYTSSEPKSGAATQTKVLLTRQQFSHDCKSYIILSMVCFLCVFMKGHMQTCISVAFLSSSKN